MLSRDWSGLCTGCTKLCNQTFWRFFRNERAQSSILDTKLMFWCILRDFTNVKTTSTNLVRVVHRMHKTMQNQLSGDSFATNMPNPPYWTQNSCFGAFRAILPMLKRQVRVVHLMHKTMQTNFLEILLQRTCPTHHIRRKTHVLMYFAPFRQCENGKYKLCTGCTKLCKRTFRVFFSQ